MWTASGWLVNGRVVYGEKSEGDRCDDDWAWSRMLRYGVVEVRQTSSAAGSTVSSRCAPKRSALVSCAEVLATGWTMADVMCQDGGTSRR